MITKPGWQSAIVMIILIISSLSGVVTATELFVNGDTGNDSWDGLTPEWDGVHGPKKTIQAGIDASIDDDTVQVADGTYTGDGNRDIDFGGRAITLQSENGAENTVIDCEGTESNPHRGFYFHFCEGAESVVDGFTIMNGFADYGGGIYCSESSPMITNCTISGNSVYHDGGGIACHLHSSPTITNCMISSNLAYGGGGIFCDDSDPTITNCTVSGNTAWGYYGSGGGIFCMWDSGPTITNCTISGNSAECSGGGIACSDSDQVITNCTISSNEAGDYGGGIYCSINSNVTMTDCILWGNSAPNGHEITMRWTSHPSTLTIRYSDVQGGAGEAYVETGCTLDLDGTNIDADPLFVRGALHDYYLSQVASGQDVDSPCVDAGSDTAVNLGLDELSTRTDGMPDEGIVDMGYHTPYALWIDSITKNGDDITIHWNARPGVSYVVEWCYDLEMWHGFGVGEVSEVTDYGGSLLQQVYYRVREE